MLALGSLASSIIVVRISIIVFMSCALGLKRQLKLELFVGAIVVVAQEVEGSICLDFNFGALDAVLMFEVAPLSLLLEVLDLRSS